MKLNGGNLEVNMDFSRRSFRRIGKRLSVIARAEWITFLSVILGTVIYAVGVMAFTVPYRFPDSGVTGIAVLANYALGVSPAIIVAAANVALLVWAWRSLPVRVILWTVFSVVLLTILMQVLRDMPFVHTDDRLLIALFGGAIKGFGGGLVLRCGASLGGLDIVVLFLRKKYGVEVGKYNFYINMVIMGVGSFIVGFENAMFGLVGVYASGLMIDNAMASFDRRRLVFVITKDASPVVKFITTELGRGATLIDAHGGYSGEDRPMLMCLLSRRQAVELKRFIGENQPHSFMVVSDATEVVGKGFKTWRV